MSFKDKNGSDESLLGNDGDSEGTNWTPLKQRQSWKGRAWFTFNLIFFFISLCLFVATYTKISLVSDMEHVRKTSFYSPVLDSINFKLRPIETEGGLFEAKNPSKWRNYLKPDPAVDEAWEDLENIRVFPITESEVRRLGKDPELLVKFPPQYGLGDNAYMAQIDMFHQIHCLNLLRHLAWAEYHRNGTAKKPFSELHWIHVSHCTDILMQNLMCSGNLDIITFNWVETQTNPFPDFAVNHQCRDFETIYEWQDKNSVPKEWGRNVTRPEGAKQIPISEEYYRIYGIEKNETESESSHSM
ncbi:hypothetical protein FPOAC2_04111 [Fusarium poae]|uniref:hypothetical protein n=1 Tax=Fusarium poae TaxID=36050 RepID=UPI001CE7DDB2|nr:hypothetical protein FPOAC1_004042 [Fusarium poae]KAG8670808.1 hypothetical protein FPOAC1_004042 [Fusarium poae]